MEIISKHRDPHPRSVREAMRPGVMISNAWPTSRATPGATAQAIAEVLARHPFFECYQTVDIPTFEERREVRRLLRDQGHPHTYTLTRLLGERSLSLSSTDPVNRTAACDLVIAQLSAALECGAGSLCVISGPRPADPGAREEALRALEDSLARICTAAQREAPDLEILIEPLDFEAHKRNTLGSTAEAVAICRRLRSDGLRLKLCLDTAHLLLNGEPVPEAVAQARDHLAEFHFCNCCPEPAHPLFGDRHLPFGPPGVVDEERIATWMAALRAGGFFAAAPRPRPRVFCEVWKPDDRDSLEIVAHCEQTLVHAWERSGPLTP